jgi:hypothetical protein
MKNIVIVLFALVCTPALYANTWEPGPGCDTLVTRDGQIILIKEVKRTAKMLQYYACDDSTRTVVTLPAEKVHLVVREGSIQRRMEREQRELADEEHRLIVSRSYITLVAGIFTLACCLLAFLVGTTFWLVGIAAGIVALINGWRISKKLRDSPEYAQEYRRMRQGIMLAGIGLGIIAALIYLAYRTV